MNIVSNSIKFTPRFGIVKVVIRVRRLQKKVLFDKAEISKTFSPLIQERFHQPLRHKRISSPLSAGTCLDEIPVQIDISVTDNGPGISESGLKNLFVDFGRLAEHENVNKIGTGLGLSICKTLVEQMNGKISVESCSEGEHTGTTFFMGFKTNCKNSNQIYTSIYENARSSALSRKSKVSGKS